MYMKQAISICASKFDGPEGISKIEIEDNFTGEFSVKVGWHSEIEYEEVVYFEGEYLLDYMGNFTHVSGEKYPFSE